MSNQSEAHWIATKAIHPDLLAVKNRVYIPSGFKCTAPVMESESAEYGASSFELNGYSIRFRVAKITPIKIGQFVTLWKRPGNASIKPYDVSDKIDFFIVSTRKEEHFGQFIFPKSVLCQRGVLSIEGKGGKMAMRVYPPWDKAINRQAQKTQKWQIDYFLEIPKNSETDLIRAQTLYS